MKHAGSQDSLLAHLAAETGAVVPRRTFAALVQRQSGSSWLAALGCALLLVAIVADAPVRDLARSLDPSVVSVLLTVTQVGNSAWPLGICLVLLAAVAIVTRETNPFPTDAVQNLRSSLLLVIGSVAVSGTIASLSKNMIGRARPSTDDAHVFEFVAMSFRAGWAAFPSGHATTATACAVALAISMPRNAVAWLSIGLLAALTRAFLGVHWLSDCGAGAALGALVSLALRNWMARRGHSFKIDPALLAQVLVKAASIGLNRAWRAARSVVAGMIQRARRQIAARKSWR